MVQKGRRDAWSSGVRTRFLLQTALVLAATLGGVPGLGTIDSGALGITSAEARVFTRKRVNGRWITGHFVSNRGSKAKTRSARTSRSKKYARLSEEREVTPPAPEPRPRSAKNAEPVLAVAVPAAAAIVTTDDRMQKLQEALQEKARVIARAVTGDSPVLDSNLSPQATGSVRPAAPEPRSVSFDFQSGVKTTVFSNGALVEEKFDVPSLKGLAAPSPAPQSAPASPALQATSALQASPSLSPISGPTELARRNPQ
jgi:hypothetical protein